MKSSLSNDALNEYLRSGLKTNISNSNLILNDTLKDAEDIARTQIQKYEKSQTNRVLILVTGGTICMVDSENGLTVQKNFIQNFLRLNPNFCDQDYTFFHSEEDFLITPETIFGKRILYRVIEWNNIIDSCNIDIIFWKNLAEFIEKYYSEFDAFIILHGTDTMAYTASALSFMLENLQKTVIITGSQIPLSFIRNDGFNNLLNSIIIAGLFTIPEVVILFRDKIFRGNRTRKFSANDLDGFDSPNFKPLAELGINMQIQWEKFLTPKPKEKFKVQKEMCDKIQIIKYHPLTSTDILEGIFKNQNIKAVILESFGAGNLPTNNQRLYESIKNAIKRDVIIVNLSQCYQYKIKAIYETGKILSNLGVIQGADMTVEATLTKLAYLLGKNLPIEEVKSLMIKNIRGEMTSIYKEDQFEAQEEHFLQIMTDSILSKSTENKELL